MGTYGQDWASYQSATPDTTGLGFAFVKVTEGLGYVNPLWARQRDHAKANGLVWGAYHYPHMGNSVQAEADYFLSQVAWKPGDLACLDWEGYDNANKGVPRSQQAAYKDAWIRYVKGKLPHNRVGMYCNTDYWRNVDTSSYAGDFLWIATAGQPAGQPGITAPWMFHQYGSAGVDRDYCPLSLADLRAWATLQTPQEIDMTPEEHTMLAELHNAMVRCKGWDYTNAQEAAAAAKAGKRAPDAWGKLGATLANSEEILTAVKVGAPLALTDSQVKALASQLVPVLVPAIVTGLGHALDGTKP